MLVITETTDKIQVVLAGAPATTQPACFASWREYTGGTGDNFERGRNAPATNSTTDVDLVGSPASGKRREIDFINIFNRDTASVTVTVKLDMNGTDMPLITVTLGAGERLVYTHDTGFLVFGNNGAVKNALANGSNVVGSELSLVTLGADVTNNNASANTIADVTGLSFAVTAGQRYWFWFQIFYTSAATATGSRWSISGPGSPTELSYKSEYSLTATTNTVNEGQSAYDVPAAANATSAAIGSNTAIITGHILPSANGNVIARFASEISSSAIIAKRGSIVQYAAVG